MIGQKNILLDIDKLLNKFPRFLIITGAKGQGKRTLAKEISKKLKYPIITCDTKIDSIREIIDLSYKQTEPIIYLIPDADKMSIGAKNSLLKLLEEPPNQAYFIMTLQSIENTLETLRSRCMEIKMQEYSLEELDLFMQSYNLNKDEKHLLSQLASNKYEMDLIYNYGINEFYDYVEKVYNNIYKVQSANSFKLAEKLAIKDDNGYDLNLFFNTYYKICFEDLFNIMAIPADENDWIEADIIGKCIDVTSDYKQKLNITGINKQSIIDCWILDIRKIRR